MKVGDAIAVIPVGPQQADAISRQPHSLPFRRIDD